MAGTPVQTGSNRAPVAGATQFSGRANATNNGPSNNQVPIGSHPTTAADEVQNTDQNNQVQMPDTVNQTPAGNLQNVGNAADATTAATPAPLPSDSTGTPEQTYAQAQKNLSNGGLAGDALSMAQQSLASKYHQTLSNVQQGGAEAPDNQGDASTAISNASPQSQDTTAVDQLFSQDPTINGLMTNITQLLSPQNQTSSLMDDYNQMYQSSGLDEINKELIDANTVINGTEDDIRNEIQSAGGMGTDSQIQAMSNARNKGLIAKYNQLTQQKTDATNQLNSMMQLDSSDKQMAQTRVNSEINNMFQLANFKQQATTNIQEGFNALVGQVGYAGALQAYSANPQGLASIEQVMGLPAGGLSKLASIPNIDMELKQSQLAASQADIQHTNLENQQLMNPGATNAADIANTVTKNNAVQNAADQQTLNSNYQTIQDILPGKNLANLTESDVAGLSNADQISIGKALARMQNPDISRAGGDAGNALQAVGIPGVIGETLHQTFTGKLYDSQKILDAIQTANNLYNGRNGGNTTQNTPTLLAPSEIPSGYYQASDGLLYKK